MLHHLNFKHLRYFLVVAQEGSITQACKVLHLTPQTVSTQIKQLESALDTDLFRKEGRRLVLTEAGHQAVHYAEQIFSLGESLQEHLQTPEVSIKKFKVGLVDVMPKLVACELLEPALTQTPPMRLECREGPIESLLSELASQKLDLILTDKPVDSSFHIKAYNHMLGESGLSVFAHPKLAEKYAKSFPESLHGAPFLMPTTDTALGHDLKQWLKQNDLSPNIVMECVDSALINNFGLSGKGLFCGPSVLEDVYHEQFKVVPIGKIPEIRERFYAITLERRIKHESVLAITQTARTVLLNTPAVSSVQENQSPDQV